MKRTITKILSILCLLAVLACAFIPCIKLTGNYKEVLNGLTAITQQFPEESITMLEQVLATQNITVDFKGSIEAIKNLTAPLEDGEISIMDFMTLSENCKNAAEKLSTFPVDGLGIPADTTDPVQQSLLGISNMVASIGQLSPMMSMASYVCLAPIGLFGLLALAIVIRIILRLFNRRGLGVLISIIGFLNAAFMVGVTVLVQMMATPELPIGAEPTFVPYVIIGGCILSCILWGIGRGAKVKKVTEEVVVEVPVETPVVEETVVEEVVEAAEEVTEEVVEEEIPVEETAEVVEE